MWCCYLLLFGGLFPFSHLTVLRGPPRVREAAVIFHQRYSARDPRNPYKSWTQRWEQSESLQQREGMPSWALPDLAAQGKCCVRHGLCTVPRVLLGVMVMPGNEASPAQQAGLYQPHPKPSWAALEQEPQFKCQTKPQEDSGLVPRCSARALPVLLLHSHWALLGRCESNCSDWLQKAQLPWDMGFFHSYGVCP